MGAELDEPPDDLTAEAERLLAQCASGDSGRLYACCAWRLMPAGVRHRLGEYDPRARRTWDTRMIARAMLDFANNQVQAEQPENQEAA